MNDPVDGLVVHLEHAAPRVAAAGDGEVADTRGARGQHDLRSQGQEISTETVSRVYPVTSSPPPVTTGKLPAGKVPDTRRPLLRCRSSVALSHCYNCHIVISLSKHVSLPSPEQHGVGQHGLQLHGSDCLEGGVGGGEHGEGAGLRQQRDQAGQLRTNQR